MCLMIIGHQPLERKLAFVYLGGIAYVPAFYSMSQPVGWGSIASCKMLIAQANVIFLDCLLSPSEPCELALIVITASITVLRPSSTGNSSSRRLGNI